MLSAGRRPLIFTAPGGGPWDIAADVVEVPVKQGRLDLVTVLSELVTRGLHSVLVEGGAQLHRSLLDLDLVDGIELFLAPRLLAGGPAWVAGPGYTLAASPRFHVASLSLVGEDVHLSLRRQEA